ncbi:MBG domain-containing protein [Chitinophaga sp. 30R24]|uniref:MBG domain-containing protein n=1 Tax=Chitinophaga sp. 30R24 TaxID=3248838 RepID=UPI003B91F2AB
MKLALLRTAISLLLLMCISTAARSQVLPGDLLFTGINIFDDNVNGNTQNDAFSFVILHSIPPNTNIYFTDLGWTGSGFQSLSCGTGNGSQTDGIIQWSSGANTIPAGQQITIFCKYAPSASVGTVTTIANTASTASTSPKTYLSLGLGGDELFAFTGTVASPTIVAGINVNRKAWQAALGSCDFTSSQSAMPATSAVLSFPSIYAVNGRYNCSILAGSVSNLRKLLTDTTQWIKDYTLAVPPPIAFDLKKTPPCNLVIVNPSNQGIVYVNIHSATPGDGSSWSSPLLELRDALMAAADPTSGITQIWVAQGTYKPTASTTDRKASFAIPSNVAVYGGFAGNEASLDARNAPANRVILSGDLNDNDKLTNGIVLTAEDIVGNNSLQVVTTLGNTGAQILLDNVIITGGKADSVSVTQGYGGGLYNASGKITVSNTQFYGNYANYGGGAVLNGGQIQLINSICYGNNALQGGAIYNSPTAQVQLTNVTISKNGALNNLGGGIQLPLGGGIFYNTIITQNIGNDVTITNNAPSYNYSIIGSQYYITTATPQSTPAVQFVDINTGNLRLTSSNFAINHGDPETNKSGYAAQAGPLDLAGQPRINNTIIDLGAYEFQAQAQALTLSPLPTLTYGDQDITPTATTTGDGTITFSSGDTAVAQIVNGKIKTTGVGTTTITANASATSSYLPAGPVSQTLTVIPKILTITANDLSRPYGTPNPAPTFKYTSFAYNDDSSVIIGTITATFSSDINSPVGTYDITPVLSGASAANYTLTGEEGTLTITPADQTITFPAIADKTYGDLPFALSTTSNSGLPVTYTVVSGPASITGNTVTITGAGAVTIAANQAGNSNYNAAPEVTQSFTIAPAVLTVTANDKTKTYGQANPAFDYTISGFVYEETSSIVSGAPDISTAADENSDAGDYTITITAGSLQAPNYTFNPVNGTLHITQAGQTITFDAVTDKTYGDAVTLNASSNVGLPITFTVTAGPATVSGNQLTITGIGSITVTATQPGNNDYLAATPVSRTFQVNPATLTVTADDKQKAYGEANPPLTYTITGFVNNEDNSVVSGAAVLNTNADASSTPGTYTITVAVGTLSAANYLFTTAGGSLTVNLAAQTITFPVITDKTYGDATFTLSATSSSSLPVTYTVISGPATITGNTVTITGAGSVTIAADQAGNSNYQPATQVTQSFTVGKAVLLVTANDKTKTYKQPNPTLDYSITGFVNDENSSVVSGNANISTMADDNSSVGDYTITVTTGNLQAANYSFDFVNGTLHTTQAGQTITFDAITDKTYGDAPVTLNASSDAGLPVTFIVTSGPATISGNMLTITGVGSITVTATQPGDNNYLAATPVSRTFQVNPATLTVTADDKQKAYGEANPPLTYTISGFVNGEGNSVVTGAPVLNTNADASSIAGSYPITVAIGSLTAVNYTFSLVNGTLTINAASQTITFPAITDKTYGDAPFTLSATSSSGLPITYTVISGPATINGNTVTITGAGAVTIAADQAGNDNHQPAVQVTQTFNIGKATLNIIARNDTRSYTGTPYTGGNGVDYISFVNGDDATKLSGTLTYSGTAQGAINTGTYTITPGGLTSNDYNLVFTDGQLTITPASQQITFNAPGDKNQGDPDFTLVATASSGLPVTFTSDNPQVISITGSTAHVGIAGVAHITASQAGDNNYTAAQPVVQTITVTAYPPPVISSQGNTIFCEGNSVTLQSTEAPAYAWYRNNVQIPGANSRSLVVTESGSYTVNAIYPNSYTTMSDAVEVTVNPLPTGSLQVVGNTTLSKGESVSLIASGGDTYMWEPAAGLSSTNISDPLARPSVTTTYQVTIANHAGCSVTESVTITVKEDYKLEATNILTPNGDGKNDLWVVKNIDMYPQNEVKIFDRAGRIVYYQRSYNNTWNGMVNGQPLAEGTYYYVIDLGANKPQFKGFITIIHDKYK